MKRGGEKHSFDIHMKKKMSSFQIRRIDEEKKSKNVKQKGRMAKLDTDL